MRLIWTDELAEEVARRRRPEDPEATWIAWLCITAGPLVTALIVGLLVRAFG